MAYDKIGKHCTKVIKDANGATRVRYHDTDVVVVNPDQSVTLNSGGWLTATTKKRMNQAAQQFGCAYGVYQKNHVWYVSTPLGDTKFFDGITV